MAREAEEEGAVRGQVLPLGSPSRKNGSSRMGSGGVAITMVRAVVLPLALLSAGGEVEL